MQSGESRGAEHTFLAWLDRGRRRPCDEAVDTLDFARAAPIADLVCLHDACDLKTKPIMGCRADKNQTFEDSIKCCDFRLLTVNV